MAAALLPAGVLASGQGDGWELRRGALKPSNIVLVVIQLVRLVQLSLYLAQQFMSVVLPSERLRGGGPDQPLAVRHSNLQRETVLLQNTKVTEGSMIILNQLPDKMFAT